MKGVVIFALNLIMEDLTELQVWSEFVKTGDSTALYGVSVLWSRKVAQHGNYFFIFILQDPRGSHSPRRKSLFFTETF